MNQNLSQDAWNTIFTAIAAAATIIAAHFANEIKKSKQ